MKIIFNIKASVWMVGALSGALVLMAAAPARANERHFTYTYESATLPKGGAELEPWLTYRAGRERFFHRFDHRFEFELGVTDRVQTSLYVNFSSLLAEDDMGQRTKEFEYEGFSNEWKGQILDPRADPIGLALYGEFTLTPDEAEIETKVIIDKWIGDKFLIAGNLVFAPEIGFAELHNTEVEYELEVDLAAAYFFTPRLSLGLEARNHNEIAEDGFEHSAFFLGPTLAYGADAYWLALTVMPQIGAAGGEGDNIRDLEEHEKVDARIIIGLHFD